MVADPELIEQLPYLRRMARALTRNAANADDLVQNCLERAIVHRHQFAEGTNLRGWLYAIMHNLFIDSIRHNKREFENSQAAQSYVAGRHTPSNQEASLELGELQQAMALLPVEQYSTLLLIALDGMSYEEAARVANVPIGTIRSRLSRARSAVIRYLEGECLGDRRSRPRIKRRPHARDASQRPCYYNIPSK